MPRTALGWVSTDPASPVDCGSSSVRATPALGIEIPAAVTSAVKRMASGHLRRPDTRPTGSPVICAPLLIEQVPPYLSLSIRMNGAGNGKFAAPSTNVSPSKTTLAVALAGRSLRHEPGALTVVVAGPVPVQRA